MARVFLAVILAFLAACTQETPVVVPAEIYRDTSAQIASQTDVTAERMSGDWVIRQRFANQAGPQRAMNLSSLPNGALQLSTVSGFCYADVCAEEETLVLLNASGPGRWTAAGPQSALPRGEIWVMWMDFDSRTATLGTPSGEFGWIMDKNSTGGRDRITAARDIMEWFGYDVSRLVEVNR